MENKKIKLSHNINKLNRLTPDLALKISNLINSCCDLDKVNYDIFMENDANYITDFCCFYLYYAEDELIGFLSIYIPDSSEAFIYACTHPLYRTKGIFTALYHTLNDEFIKHNFTPSRLSCAVNPALSTAPVLVNILTNHGFTLNRREFLMKYFTDKIIEHNPFLIELEYDDNEYGHEISFWLSETYIGGCLLDYSNPASDTKSAAIYEYGIVDEYQGKGFGKQGLILLLNYLYSNKFNETILHVSESNKIACRLYLNTGFSIIEEEDYYSK